MKYLFFCAALVLTMVACNLGNSDENESKSDQQGVSIVQSVQTVDTAATLVDTVAPTGPSAEELKAREKEEAHDAMVSKLRSRDGVYFAHDISGDGIPELFIIEGITAIKDVYVYSWHKGSLREIYNSTEYESSYYRGKGCVLAKTAHMRCYCIVKLTCRGGKLKEKVVDKGENVEDYPTPREPQFRSNPTSSLSALNAAFDM